MHFSVILSAFAGNSTGYTLFCIRTSNFGPDAQRSSYFHLFFLQFESENVLYMFLKLCGIEYCNKSMRTWLGTSYQSALFTVMWYQVACHMVVRLSLMPRLQTELFFRVSCNKKTTLLMLKNVPKYSVELLVLSKTTVLHFFYIYLFLTVKICDKIL